AITTTRMSEYFFMRTCLELKSICTYPTFSVKFFIIQEFMRRYLYFSSYNVSFALHQSGGFMKILKRITLVIAAILLIAIAGLMIFILTFDANQYKSQILAQAEKVLGRKVVVENISLTLS